jgi:hypothetical protein
MTRRHKLVDNFENFSDQGIGWSMLVKNSEKVPCLIGVYSFAG